ncbi:MAG: hypothetical protein F6K00_20180 [Leptolyngbya sp. SIOISBB]|nr:hypothetical protein [Leptolyngbya sp. SIOISBB]
MISTLSGVAAAGAPECVANGLEGLESGLKIMDGEALVHCLNTATVFLSTITVLDGATIGAAIAQPP